MGEVGMLKRRGGYEERALWVSFWKKFSLTNNVEKQGEIKAARYEVLSGSHQFNSVVDWKLKLT